MIIFFQTLLKACMLCLLIIVSASNQSKGQSVNLNHLVDSNCTLYVSLTDSNNTILSDYPPYLFSIGNTHLNNPSLALTSLDLQNYPDSLYVVNCIDGQQNSYTISIANPCAAAPDNSLTSIVLDSFNNSFACPNCNGTAEVSIFAPNGNYTFEWSNGFIDTNTTVSYQGNLCPGTYYVLATDSNSNTYSTSFDIACSSVPLPVASCNSFLSLYLDYNGQLELQAQDLSSILIVPDTNDAFIVDMQGNYHQQLSLDCDDIGYHMLQLLIIDKLSNLTDTCQVLVQVQDSLNTCSYSSQYTVIGTGTNSSDCSTCDGVYVINNIVYNNNNNQIPSPYTYLWSNGNAAGPTAVGLCPNTAYSVTIADINGNHYQHNFSINCNSGPTNCYDPQNINTSIPCPSANNPVCGCNGITYPNACVAQYQHGIINYTSGVCNSSFVVNVGIANANLCDSLGNNCDGQINLTVSGGTPPFSYQWSDSTLLGPSLNNLCPGNYVVTVTDSNSDRVYRLISVGTEGCVWPGDADDNAVANHFDLLPIGLAYNTQGIPRNTFNTFWNPLSMQDWPVNPIQGLPNHKHFDCDGNGIIDSIDQTVIVQNYGQTYQKSTVNGLWGPNPFYVESAVAQLGDSLQLDIILGDSSNAFSNAYAVAFTLEYDTALIEGNTVNLTFANSWLGNDLMEIQRNYTQDGAVEIALSRKDRLPVGGFGRIGSVDFTIKDDVWIGKVNNPDDNLIAPIIIRGIRLIDNNNNELGSNPQTSTVEIDLVNANKILMQSSAIQLFPNPVQNNLQIVANNCLIEQVSINSIDGRLLKQIQLSSHSNRLQIAVDNLAAGVYIIQINSSKGLYQERLIVRD